MFHPEFLAFCHHWGMSPRTYRHYRMRRKGKVEGGVGYVKSNALGRLTFASWEALDAHPVWWMREAADVRIHGTTFKQPIACIESRAGGLSMVTAFCSSFLCGDWLGLNQCSLASPEQSPGVRG